MLTFPRNPRRWAGLTSIAFIARYMGGHPKATTRVPVVILIKMAIQPRVMGVQVGPRRRGRKKAQTLHRLFAKS